MVNQHPKRALPNAHSAWWVAMLSLTVGRLLMWALMVNDIPHLESHFDPWHFFYSGDINLYLEMAQRLARGEVLRGVSVGMGWPWLLAGLMRFMNATDHDGVIPAVVIVCGGWLGVLSVPVFGAIGRQATRSKLLGVLIAALWALFPYLLWIGFGLHPKATELRDVYVGRQMWLSPITDGPALFFALLGWAFVLRSLRHNSIRAGVFAILGGLVLGFGIATRIHMASVAVPLFVGLVLARRWRELGLFGSGLLIGYLPQFWYSAVADCSPLNLPYVREWLSFTCAGKLHVALGSSHFSIDSLINSATILVGRLPLVVILAVAGLTVGVYTFGQSWRKAGRVATLSLFGAPSLNYAIHVVTYVYATDPIRFTLPAISLGLPVFVWMGSLVLENIWKRSRKVN